MKKTIALTTLLLFGSLLYSQLEPSFIINFDTGSVYFDLISDTQHIWQVGPPQKTILNTASSAPNVLITDTILEYSNNVNSYTEVLVPNACWGINMSFKYKIDSEKNKDGIKIEMSFDHNRWFNIAYRDSFPYTIFNNSLINNYDTLYTLEPGITGSDTVWHNFDLNAVYYYPVRKTDATFGDFDSIWFRFTFLSDSINTGEGFMMDDFKVEYSCGGNVTDLENNSISFYPIPVSSILHIDNKSNEYYSAKIYDSESKFIKSFILNYTSLDIDVEAYSKGIYIIQFCDKNSKMTYKKFIKE